MNIPFELIFIIFFFVLPALSSLQKRLRERSQGERRDAERPDPNAEQRPAAPVLPPQANTSQRPAPLETPTTPSDLGSWLEEAQRRVREAREAEAQGRRGGQTPPANRPPRPTVAAPRQAPPRQAASRPRSAPPRAGEPAGAPRRTPPRSLEGSSLEGDSLERSRPERTAGAAATEVTLDTAPPMHVQRLQGGERATIKQRVRLDEESVMNGFIWHQVLSPPLSKRRRTRLSRRQP